MENETLQKLLDNNKFPKAPNQSDVERPGDINLVSWEFGWRRRLNLILDGEGLVEEARKLGEQANRARTSSTQINHLTQIVTSASTWSEVINYLNRQMAKGDQRVWRDQLKSKLNELVDVGKQESKGAPFDQMSGFDAALQQGLRDQEAALILCRGFIDRFGGFFHYYNSQPRQSQPGWQQHNRGGRRGHS